MVIYMVDLQKNKFRYERKYVIENVDLPSFIHEILSKSFLEVFNERRINNLYYDSINLDSIVDNIDGLSERKKYRIRWYGNTFKRSLKQFEVKFKSEFLNSKKIFNIGEFQIKDYSNFNISHKNLVRILKNKDLVLYEIMQSKFLKLFNSYNRKYYLSSNKNIRITIDTDLNFYSPLTKNVFKEKKIIVEIKYNKEFKFLNEFKNLRINKYSKYVKGVVSTTFYNPIY